jgi:hypothetical protein
VLKFIVPVKISASFVETALRDYSCVHTVFSIEGQIVPEARKPPGLDPDGFAPSLGCARRGGRSPSNRTGSPARDRRGVHPLQDCEHRAASPMKMAQSQTRAQESVLFSDTIKVLQEMKNQSPSDSSANRNSRDEVFEAHAQDAAEAA